MATFQQFEDIDAWQRARELVQRIYTLTDREEFGKDFSLKDQIRRAGVSIMSNIAEGFERDGTREFIQFLSIAKGSVGEVRSQLYVAFDRGYVTRDEFENLVNLASETARLIAGLVNYLKKSRIRGTKYH